MRRETALRNVTLEEARQFHSEFYGATRGHMAIVGDFDREAVMPIVEEIFGDWVAEAPTERLGDRYFDVEPINETNRTPDKPNAFFIAGLNLPLSDSDDYPALLMGNFMLGGGFLNSRLAVRIRQNEGISYSGASGISGHPIEQSGAFQAFAIYAPENVQKLEQAFME
ncbi:MAG TPA: insulinase family protein [Longimicrobiales bacterium]|nr:insulinase family protein [Longimicrobiales bacterium]